MLKYLLIYSNLPVLLNFFPPIIFRQPRTRKVYLEDEYNIILKSNKCGIYV